MADYLLDTNILSYWYDDKRPEHKMVQANLAAALQPDPLTKYVSRLFISVVVRGEIEYGCRANPTQDNAKHSAYLAFVEDQCPEPLELNKHVVEQYGELRAWLFEKCAPNVKKSKAKRAEELIHPTTGKELHIDENDIWIAAHARTYNLILVTNDSRGNFGKLLEQFFPSLKCQNWAK